MTNRGRPSGDVGTADVRAASAFDRFGSRTDPSAWKPHPRLTPPGRAVRVRSCGDALVGRPTPEFRRRRLSLGSDGWFRALSRILPPRTTAIGRPHAARAIARRDQPSVLLVVQSEPQSRLRLGELGAEIAGMAELRDQLGAQQPQQNALARAGANRMCRGVVRQVVPTEALPGRAIQRDEEECLGVVSDRLAMTARGMRLNVGSARSPSGSLAAGSSRSAAAR